MTNPTTIAIGPDLVARIDRKRHPILIVLERKGNPIAVLPWHKTQVAYDKIQDILRSEPDPAQPLPAGGRL